MCMYTEICIHISVFYVYIYIYVCMYIYIYMYIIYLAYLIYFLGRPLILFFQTRNKVTSGEIRNYGRRVCMMEKIQTRGVPILSS